LAALVQRDRYDRPEHHEWSRLMRRVYITQNILDPDQFLTDMTDPEFAADWWERFERGFRQMLAAKRAVAVWLTPWEWSVEPLPPPSGPARQIVGSCWARPP
jgi:hypothetical protein